MHQFLLLGIFIFVPAIAVAATPHGQAAAHWSSQAACEMATQEKCTQDGAKAWHGTGASSRQAVPPVSKPATVPAAPVAVSPNVKPVQAESPPPPAPTEAAKPNEGFYMASDIRWVMSLFKSIDLPNSWTCLCFSSVS